MPIFASLFVALNLVKLGSPSIKPLELINPLQDKNFYLLSRMQSNPQMNQLIAKDSELRSIVEGKEQALKSSANESTIGKVAGLTNLKFSPEEFALVSKQLSKIAVETPAGRAFMTEIRQSHAYERDAQLSDSEFIQKAWQECAEGMNLIVDIYGTQTDKGRSPEINGPIYKSNNIFFGGLIKTFLTSLLDHQTQDKLFFEPTLNVATSLLRCQVRDEAARFEPMEKGVNRAAFSHARSVNWSQYSYSSILVPGYGPEEPEVQLSPAGWIACSEAAIRYRDKKAPFIIVSGGFVHPNRTRFSEAIEMKACLINEFHIPEDAIIVDPHARHTTTNVRNATRLIARYGMPIEMPGLIVTNPFQANDICEAAFERRCQGIFGFLPGTNYRRLSNFDVSYQPNLVSLSIDPRDPLDP